MAGQIFDVSVTINFARRSPF